MYEELIKQMRSVYQEIDCPDCPLAKDCMKLQGVCAFTRAADAIEELTDTNVGKWIPVRERLPEFNENVLVYSAHSGLICIDANIQFDRNATHWMPLPQPPKEETNDEP